MQGAILTLPYCLCNSEVRAVIKLHWNRSHHTQIRYYDIVPTRGHQLRNGWSLYKDFSDLCRILSAPDKNHWIRWLLVRSVGAEYRTTVTPALGHLQVCHVMSCHVM